MRCYFPRIRSRWLRLRIKSCLISMISLILVIFIIYNICCCQRISRFNSFFSSHYNGLRKFLFYNTSYKIEPFIPGKFLKSVSPSNISYCNFQFSLPDHLELPSSEINFSPELDSRSGYRVVYNVLKADVKEKVNVTLCTHATPDFIYYLVEILTRWEGPVSVASFVPGTDAGLLICQIERLCHCLPDMARVSLHFVFPLDSPPELIDCDFLSPGCAPPTLFQGAFQTFRSTHSLIYPINIARNVARVKAETNFLLVSDIELFPSKNLVSKFISMILSLRSKSKSNIDVFFNKIVYVVPVFEVEWDEVIPSVKSELLDLYSFNKAFYFHRWVCSHCQRFPGLQRWLLQKKKSLDTSIEPFFVVRREYPFHRWEPVFIGTHAEPYYSELLSWEGQQDKMTQMHEMCLMEYRFVILDGAFLVHAPGVKRKNTGLGQWRSDLVSANSHHYDRIIERMTLRLKNNHRCRRH